jgi:YegS/Rv2252/BmrU family lipid kinase
MSTPGAKEHRVKSSIRLGVVISGRYARASKMERRFQEECKAREIFCLAGITDPAKHAGWWAEYCINQRCSHIVIAGGDGTLHQAIQPVLRCDKAVRPVLIPLPSGSGNDFARSVNAPVSVEAVFTLIETGSPAWVDAGCIEISARETVPHTWFLNIADAGLGGAVSKYLHQAPRWAGPEIMYQWSILRTLITYKPVNMFVKIDGLIIDGPCLNVVVANGAFFGSGLHIAPGASVTDGKFTVVVLGAFTVLDYLRFLPDIKAGRKINHPAAHYFETAEVTFHAPEAAIEADGEYVGTAPVRMYVVPGALPMLF